MYKLDSNRTAGGCVCVWYSLLCGARATCVCVCVWSWPRLLSFMLWHWSLTNRRIRTTRVANCLPCPAALPGPVVSSRHRHLHRNYTRRFLCQEQVWDFQCLGYNINGSYCQGLAPIPLPE